MKKFILNIVVSFFLLSAGLLSQKQAGIWYFGRNAGLSFCSGKAVALTDGAMNTKEGCASIAGRNCNLLFYTDGIRVWNRKHRLMPNGFGLYGDSSATQSGVIVPQPGNDSIYFLFTVDDNLSTHGFNYSIINMNLDNGFGDVVVKNVNHISECVEKIASVYHSNGKDIWVIAHEWNNNTFRAFLLTESGLDASSVASSVGYVHSGNSDSQNKIGYLAASPQGDKLACAVKWSNLLEIFDFDNTTGVISNPMRIQDNDFAFIYGVGFSPEGKRLYVGTRSRPFRLYQFNMETSDILNSFIKLAESNYEFGAIQAGPDGKMYVALRDHDYLGMINDPEVLGTGCDFVHDGIYLSGRKSGLGLPTFIQSYFKPDVILSSNGPLCEGDSLLLLSTFVEGAEYYWTGPGGYLSDKNNVVLSPARADMSGYYELRVIFPQYNDTSFYKINIEIYPRPDVRVIPWNDVKIMLGESVVLNVSTVEADVDYSWSTGESGTEITVNQEGVYTVYAENQWGCVDSFAVEVAVVDLPDVSISSKNGHVICTGDSILLEVTPYSDVFNYFWSTGESGRSIVVRSSGTFSVVVENPDKFTKESESFVVRMTDNTLSVNNNGSIINFGSGYIGDMICMPVEIRNISDVLMSIEDIFLKRNIDFSIPQNQFNLNIPPGESGLIDVCFRSNGVGEKIDTLIIQDSCSDHILVLTALSEANNYYGVSHCNVGIKMVTNASANEIYASVNPNPFNGDVRIDYYIKEESEVNVKIYNTMGLELETLKQGILLYGSQSFEWNPQNISSGIYFVVIETTANNTQSNYIVPVVKY